MRVLQCFSFILCISGMLADGFIAQKGLHRIKRATCDKKYSDIDPNHSMCLNDVGTEVTLSAAEKQSIVDKHNLLRGVPGQPQATNMQKIVWDDEIAKVASKWVRQCGSGATAHEKDSKQRLVPDLPGVSIGQNAANGFQTFDMAIQAWYDEVSDFQYGVGTTNGGVVGHYTQVVNANVARIGCGKAMCNGRPHYVCDYAKAQLSTELKQPYQTGNGDQCSSQRDVTRALCDCKGLLCFNGGSIDLNTCTCSCPILYKGNQCEQVNCPKEDGVYCRTQWPVSYCDMYSNVPEDCPFMCGICKVGTTCNLKCKNGGVADSSTGKCRCNCDNNYSGDLCEIDRCAQAERMFCTYIQVTPAQCNMAMKSLCPKKCGLCTGPACGGMTCSVTGQYFNKETCECVPLNVSCGVTDNPICTLFFSSGYPNYFCFTQDGADICPNSCGHCAAPKCTKQCQNGGRLDIVSCSCECELPYHGRECEIDSCENPDNVVCENLGFTPDNCTEFFKPMCPHLCDICPPSCPNTTCKTDEVLIEADCSCKYMGDCSIEDNFMCQMFVQGQDDCAELPDGLTCPHACSYCS